jgi:hypothetical protein
MHVQRCVCRFSLGVVVLLVAHPLEAGERFENVDDYIQTAMAKWDVPAFAIAVVKDGGRC